MFLSSASASTASEADISISPLFSSLFPALAISTAAPSSLRSGSPGSVSNCSMSRKVVSMPQARLDLSLPADKGMIMDCSTSFMQVSTS